MKSEVRTGVGHGDFVALIRVEPDLATSALEHASGEPLLELQRHHRCSSWSTSRVLREKKKNQRDPGGYYSDRERYIRLRVFTGCCRVASL